MTNHACLTGLTDWSALTAPSDAAAWGDELLDSDDETGWHSQQHGASWMTAAEDRCAQIMETLIATQCCLQTPETARSWNLNGPEFRIRP